MCVRFIIIFFPILYDIVLSLVDDDVLILPGAVSTPVDNSLYFFNIGNWLVNLLTMGLLMIGESPFI